MAAGLVDKVLKMTDVVALITRKRPTSLLFAACFQMLAPSYSLADVLRCTIENYGEDVYITTPPDTNSSDGQYARIGISRGIGNRAIVVADRMGATAFVELNADDTPIGLLTLQKDLRVIKSRQSIDTNGMVFAPHQSPGVCTRLS